MLRWGRRRAPGQLKGGPGQLFSAYLATRRRKCRGPWTQKGSIGGLCPPRAEGPSDASRHDATCCRPRRPGRSHLCRLRRPGRRAAASGRLPHVLARSPQDGAARRGRRPGGTAGDGRAVAQRRRRDRGRPGAARRHRGDRRETGSVRTRHRPRGSPAGSGPGHRRHRAGHRVGLPLAPADRGRAATRRRARPGGSQHLPGAGRRDGPDRAAAPRRHEHARGVGRPHRPGP